MTCFSSGAGLVRGLAWFSSGVRHGLVQVLFAQVVDLCDSDVPVECWFSQGYGMLFAAYEALSC
jgi:hypothetical protein